MHGSFMHHMSPVLQMEVLEPQGPEELQHGIEPLGEQIYEPLDDPVCCWVPMCDEAPAAASSKQAGTTPRLHAGHAVHVQPQWAACMVCCVSSLYSASQRAALYGALAQALQIFGAVH